MPSESRCLVDAQTLIEAARRGDLQEFCRRHRVATGRLTFESVTYWRDETGVAHAIELPALVQSGDLEVLDARAGEVATVLRLVGDGGLGMAELELVALALGGQGTAVTEDPAAHRCFERLGVTATTHASREFGARIALRAPASGTAGI